MLRFFPFFWPFFRPFFWPFLRPFLRPLFWPFLTVLISIPSGWSPEEKKAAQPVTASAIAAHVRFLADDLLEGRGPGTRGSELAMRYIATEMERLGLKPAGDAGSFFQRFAIVGLKSQVVAPPTLTFERKPQLTLQPVTDCVVSPGTQAGSQKIDGAELVFVGYGIDAPEQKWNDFKDADVRGKVLVVMNSDPEDDPALFAGKTRLYYGRWTYKYEEAARRGAAGALIIHTTPSAGYPWQVVQSSWQGEQFELPLATPAAGGEPRVTVRMWATEEAVRRMVALGGKDLDELRKQAQSRDFRPVPLGVKLSVALKTEVRKLETANVLGLLPGQMPGKADEVVVYSAHHDHLGVKAEKNGDNIYNGALDNASGVAAMLAAAEGLSETKPRRSILFAAVGVEESGLLGSEYFVHHADVGKLAANLNIDGINIWGRTRDVAFIGLGKSSLDEVVKKAAGEQGRSVVPDPFPDRGHFYRSDQLNFARAGVPAVYLDEGTDFIGRPPGWGRQQVEEYVARNYHQPSDQINDAWNLDGAVDDIRLLTVVGLRIANAPSLPTWRPGDEFEAARKKALARP
jgi:Zn-dependent M28 family amino/carboxypeptidase